MAVFRSTQFKHNDCTEIALNVLFDNVSSSVLVFVYSTHLPSTIYNTPEKNTMHYVCLPCTGITTQNVSLKANFVLFGFFLRSFNLSLPLCPFAYFVHSSFVLSALFLLFDILHQALKSVFLCSFVLRSIH